MRGWITVKINASVRELNVRNIESVHRSGGLTRVTMTSGRVHACTDDKDTIIAKIGEAQR